MFSFQELSSKITFLPKVLSRNFCLWISFLPSYFMVWNPHLETNWAGEHWKSGSFQTYPRSVRNNDFRKTSDTIREFRHYSSSPGILSCLKHLSVVTSICGVVLGLLLCIPVLAYSMKTLTWEIPIDAWEWLMMWWMNSQATIMHAQRVKSQLLLKHHNPH